MWMNEKNNNLDLVKISFGSTDRSYSTFIRTWQFDIFRTELGLCDVMTNNGAIWHALLKPINQTTKSYYFVKKSDQSFYKLNII